MEKMGRNLFFYNGVQILNLFPTHNNNRQILMREQTKFHIIFIILTLLHLSRAQNNTTEIIYCSSTCVDYVSACFGIASDNCYACTRTLYNQTPSNGTCIQSLQRSVKVFELQTDAMDLTGYQTTNPTPEVCGNYSLSGSYTAGDYISKTFSGLGSNHYEAVIRFGIGYIGTWSESDQIQIEIGSETFVENYQCNVTDDICSGSGSDCFKIIEYNISHSSPNLTLKVSSFITQTDPTIQYWGLKDLTVAVKTCHGSCLTCSGDLLSECLSCSAGYFLLGNTCVSQCAEYTLPEIRQCASKCPLGYFQASSNICLRCEDDCMVCKDASTCKIWSDGSSNESSWERNFYFWIILMVIGFLLVLFIIWRLLIKRYIDKKLSEGSEDLQNHMLSDQVTGKAKKDKKLSPVSLKNLNSESKINEPSEIQINERWVESIPAVEQIAVTNPRRKKRRTRDMLHDVADQQVNFSIDTRNL